MAKRTGHKKLINAWIIDTFYSNWVTLWMFFQDQNLWTTLSFMTCLTSTWLKEYNWADKRTHSLLQTKDIFKSDFTLRKQPSFSSILKLSSVCCVVLIIWFAWSWPLFANHYTDPLRWSFRDTKASKKTVYFLSWSTQNCESLFQF